MVPDSIQEESAGLMRCSGDWDVFHVAPQILHCQLLVLRLQMATRILLQRQLDLECPSLPLTSMFHPEPSTAFCGFLIVWEIAAPSLSQRRETKGHCFQAFAMKRDKRSLFPGVCNEERQKVTVSMSLQ